MAIENEIKVLKNVSLFRSMNDDILRLIAFGSEHLSFAKGQALFLENESANGGFLILKGSVHLIKKTEKGSEIIALVNSGSLIGELALITKTVRPCGAIAAQNVEILLISKNLMHRVLKEYPELAAFLHAQISEQFAQFLNSIANLSDKFSG
jgi:CRP-like cAMP-binding protein